MKAIKFDEATNVLAENQPEYEPLPVFINNSKEAEMICCFELSDEELEEVIKTRKIWYTQLTFGNLFHPMHLSTQTPFQHA